MTKPNEFSIEALMDEKGLVLAGLPEGLRRELDRLTAARQFRERAREKRQRVDSILASIAECDARREELQKELAATLREYTEFAEAAAGVA